ncbi:MULTISPECIES: extracellular solute-binding protein [unclassified Oceanobacter]|uniref:extracellular solute-binding protein n=3 Tax=Gammaproteobacteria TaxID=1236 RepID=UPI0026E24E4B|nr:MULTISPECIES: extracellular solute-binding protein [unclassified Oceanobacter]MDO6682705.1 extracellular solute-binding protein [Oceanobacter sp. 5_MG-2023]MDP2507184.1 extracellular solute-binding protein [Oceanobacter sp. 3_MG-2023]MDP2549147.1 extracellular solute-binding protein [Oceanobacter sp. 4_MG-2023]MDP2609056.1 extracellular solute-binding protein [Oceanobacter sp. 1_MG-2023]MDP2612378.1 extracellular solute-binding protein [Oceanobacter sp. 2_MG-2023]
MMLARLAGWLLVCALSLGGLAVQAQEETPVLRVLNWSDYIEPGVLEAFEKEFNIEIDYVEFDSLDKFATLYFDDRQQFDLIFPPSRIMNTLASKSLVRPLMTQQLPDWDSLRPDILSDYSQQDDGVLNGVPYMWGTTGLGVNRKALAELGLADYENSWALLFDPDVRQKVAQCGIGLLNERDEIFAAALSYLGYSVNSLSKEQLQQAGQLLKDSLGEVSYLHTTQYLDDLASGKICVAVGYSGDLLTAAAGNADLSYFIPREGAALWIDVMAIPTNANSPELAYQLIRFLMRGNIAAKNSNYLEYPTAMASANRFVEPEILNNPVIYPAMAQLHEMEALAPRGRSSSRVMQRLWVDAICARGNWCSVPMSSMF